MKNNFSKTSPAVLQSIFFRRQESRVRYCSFKKNCDNLIDQSLKDEYVSGGQQYRKLPGIRLSIHPSGYFSSLDTRGLTLGVGLYSLVGLAKASLINIYFCNWECTKHINHFTLLFIRIVVETHLVWIQYFQTQYTRVKRPYGRCVDKQVGSENYYSVRSNFPLSLISNKDQRSPSQSFPYSLDTCFASCLQRAAVERCGCSNQIYGKNESMEYCTTPAQGTEIHWGDRVVINNIGKMVYWHQYRSDNRRYHSNEITVLRSNVSFQTSIHFSTLSAVTQG